MSKSVLPGSFIEPVKQTASQLSIVTTIGMDLEVTVYFDYDAAEPETEIEPGVPSSVTLSDVEVYGEKGYQLIDVLDEGTLDLLTARCLESVENCDER